MRKYLSILLALAFALTPLSVTAAQATAQDQQPQGEAAKLTNQDVLDMLKANLTPEVVIAKIRSSATSFDTSTAALQQLKAAAVPDEVILAMVQASSSGTAPLPATGTGAISGETVEVKVPDGTEMEIELKNNVSGQEVKVGDIVDFTIIRPVQVNGVTIIDKGASARGRITTAKKAGRWGKAGKLEWAMQDVQAIDGNRLPARFTKRDVGDSKGGTVAVAAVATTVLLGPVGLLWGLKKGKPAVIPAGNRYTVFVHGDTAVKGKAATAAAQ